jgi:hypothetical protein
VEALTGMIEGLNLIEELLHGKTSVPQILHVYLPLSLINQVNSRSRHTKFADAIH